MSFENTTTQSIVYYLKQLILRNIKIFLDFEMVFYTSNNSEKVPTKVKFSIAGLSGMGATLVVQPLDLIKNRMQLSGEGGTAREHSSSLGAVKSIMEKEGIRGFYAGMSANLFRQATYTTFRIGIFDLTVDFLNKSGYAGLLPQITAGLVAGFFGAVIATPSDVALVRMTADGKLPLAERRGYKNILDALIRIAGEERAKGLFAGLGPTILRAMVANVTQLVSYTQAKSFLIRNGYMEDTTACHFISSLFSGFVYAFCSCPLDVAKTRMQYMKGNETKPLYSGVFDVISKTIKMEGVSALWKGFVPLYARIAPHTILLFIFVEKLTSLYKEKVMKQSTPQAAK